MLTNALISAAKPREKPFKLSDGGGLYLLVNPDRQALVAAQVPGPRQGEAAELGRFP